MTEGEAVHDLNCALLDAIEETISGLLSRSVLAALYEHLAQRHSIARSELPSRLETLCEVLQQTIGYSATRTVERAIAKALFSRMKIPFNSSPNRTLVDYVEEAKKLVSEGFPSRL